MVKFGAQIVGQALTEIEKLPSAIAEQAEGIEDIATVSEIVHTQVHSTLSRLSVAGDDIDIPDEEEESEIQAPEGADTSQLILVE